MNYEGHFNYKNMMMQTILLILHAHNKSFKQSHYKYKLWLKARL